MKTAGLVSMALFASGVGAFMPMQPQTNRHNGQGPRGGLGNCVLILVVVIVAVVAVLLLLLVVYSSRDTSGIEGYCKIIATYKYWRIIVNNSNTNYYFHCQENPSIYIYPNIQVSIYLQIPTIICIISTPKNYTDPFLSKLTLLWIPGLLLQVNYQLKKMGKG